MASVSALISRVSALSRTMGDALQLRGFKPGGTVGQIPIKGAGGDFDWDWADVEGAGEVVTTYAQLTDKATVDLPTINTPLLNALSGKQPLSAVLTATTASFTAAQETKLDGIEAGATADQDLSALAPLASPTFTGTVTIPSGASIAGYLTTAAAAAAYQPLGSYAPASGIAPSAITGTAVVTNDARLSDARTPTTHTHLSADITDAASSNTAATNDGKVVKWGADGTLTAKFLKALDWASQGWTFLSTKLRYENATYYQEIIPATLTANSSLTLPNASGTLANTASTTGIPDALENATISGTVTFSGTGQASMRDALAATTITEATTARTLALSDSGNYIRCTHASGCAITIPQQTTVAWPDGSIIYIRRATGAGAITLAGAGITYNDSGAAGITAGQSFALRKSATDSWDFI